MNIKDNDNVRQPSVPFFHKRSKKMSIQPLETKTIEVYSKPVPYMVQTKSFNTNRRAS